MALYWALEGGGSKFVCGVGSGFGDLQTETIPTTSPQETMQRVICYFNRQINHGNSPKAIGIGMFGPIQLRSESTNYGQILNSPKVDWSGTNIVGVLKQAFPKIPIILDTDVNVGALGEKTWGAARGVGTFLYFTVGTGIGGSACVDGTFLRGLLHTEMGHMRVPHDWVIDPYPGSCPYHGDCLEGLASGFAIKDRSGSYGELLSVDSDLWDLTATYLGFGISNIISCFSPQLIVLGGGVMQRDHLVQMVRKKVVENLGGYPPEPKLTNMEESSRLIQKGDLGQTAGILGAIALARSKE